MAKYRIKIVTYNNEQVHYFPQVKYFLFWKNLLNDGKSTEIESLDEVFSQKSFDKALQIIDNHRSGKHLIKSVEIHYVE